MELADAIRRGADQHDEQHRFDNEGRKGYLNASEALSCIRKQWYGKHQPEEDADGPENWGYARRGSHGESYMVDRLRRANVPMLFTGDDQVRIVDEDLRIACTPDGLIEAEDGWWAVEFKTIDPRTNVGRLPREEHRAQVQIAAALFEAHRDEFPELGSKPLIGAKVLYMDASNYDQIYEHSVPLKHSILKELKGRANRVLDNKSASRMPREGAKGTKAECKQRCNWTKVCGVDGAATTTAQGVKGGAEMDVQVAGYLERKEYIALAKKEQDAYAERIKAILKKQGVTETEVDGHSVKLTPRAGAVSYAKAVKEHLPDLDLKPYRGQPTQVLTVK